MIRPGTILIGGGTGFIGSALANALKSKGYGIRIVSRKPGPSHMTWTDVEKHGLPENCQAVYSLAGQNIFDASRRWTPGFKQNVCASRINTTATLAAAIEKAEVKPDVFISISGVGYYKPCDKTEYTEESSGGDFDFLSNLARQWEAASQLSPACSKTRRVIIRSGVVLGREGGVIQQMYWPFFLGAGGPVASGTQYFPWIHVEDMIGLLMYSLENEKVSGVLNGVAPQQILNRDFASALGRAMWRPSFFPLPAFVLNALFSEERAKIMTEGQKVLPKRVLELGYKYKFPDITSACQNLASFGTLYRY